jgi:hypothetical protein
MNGFDRARRAVVQQLEQRGARRVLLAADDQEFRRSARH